MTGECQGMKKPLTIGQFVFWFCLACLVALALSGCSAWLPMTGDIRSVNESEVKRIAAVTHLSEEQVRDPVIHEVHEVKLSFLQMLDECYVAVPWYLKVLGSIPMACTKILQQPWDEKVAIIYYWPPLAAFTLRHEKLHAKGDTHAYW